MKKQFTILSILLFSFLSFNTWAQSNNFYNQAYKSRNIGTFGKDYSLINASIGLVNFNGVIGNPPFGPLYLQYEHGIMEEVGIAPFFAISHASSNIYTGHGYYDYKHRKTVLGIGAMGYYHFNKLVPVNKLDLYAGIGLGMKIYLHSYSDRRPDSDSGIMVPFKLGARWYFTPNFAVYGETGWDSFSAINFGVSFKL